MSLIRSYKLANCNGEILTCTANSEIQRVSLTPMQFPTDIHHPLAMRKAGKACLINALIDARQHTLKCFEAYENRLQPPFVVAQRAELNPPLWELGHIGWFQECWIARNPERSRGRHADPLAARMSSVLANADSLYDSTHVAHHTRWQLPLLDLAQTKDFLNATLQATLAALERANESDADLYFYRLALFHEDMHAEAFGYMARNLGLEQVQGDGERTVESTNSKRARDESARDAGVRAQAPPAKSLRVEACLHTTGLADVGFTFDNERGEHTVELGAFHIQSRLVSEADFAQFLNATQTQTGTSRKFNTGNGSAPVLHLRLAQAQAYCAWVGGRLPTEHEWEAACALVDLEWGGAWEWTSSVFGPYPGFSVDPYVDYSEPWFGTRQVLRGASSYTRPRMRHPRYRNYFTGDRSDVATGFRVCFPIR